MSKDDCPLKAEKRVLLFSLYEASIQIVCITLHYKQPEIYKNGHISTAEVYLKVPKTINHINGTFSSTTNIISPLHVSPNSHVGQVQLNVPPICVQLPPFSQGFGTQAKSKPF